MSRARKWAQVAAWRDALRAVDPAPHMPHLSPQGARAAWEASLDALHDAALDHAASIGGVPYKRAAVVCAGTVATAAIEWAAVLLGRGGSVVIKHPHDQPDVAPLLASTAQALGLDLTASGSRASVRGAELIVAMGRDETVDAVRRAHPRSRVIPLGHRVSAAWVTARSPAAWDLVAVDLALHDGRGCMSPSVVLTTRPLEEAVEGLAAAMAARGRRWPRGPVSPAEAAEIRARSALARVCGVMRARRGWAVHGLPPGKLRLASLPRAPVVVSVSSLADAAEALFPWSAKLSTVGTDESYAAGVFYRVGASRVCALGAMQRPPLHRVHDGHDLLRVTIRGG